MLNDPEQIVRKAARETLESMDEEED